MAQFLQLTLLQLGGEKELLKKTDLKLTGPKPIILDTINNPVDRITAKYMDTGSYLRPHDMQFCVERTKFAEEKIVAWFKRFRLRIFPATC